MNKSKCYCLLPCGNGYCRRKLKHSGFILYIVLQKYNLVYLIYPSQCASMPHWHMPWLIKLKILFKTKNQSYLRATHFRMMATAVLESTVTEEMANWVGTANKKYDEMTFPFHWVCGNIQCARALYGEIPWKGIHSDFNFYLILVDQSRLLNFPPPVLVQTSWKEFAASQRIAGHN